MFLLLVTFHVFSSTWQISKRCGMYNTLGLQHNSGFIFTAFCTCFSGLIFLLYPSCRTFPTTFCLNSQALLTKGKFYNLLLTICHSCKTITKQVKFQILNVHLERITFATTFLCCCFLVWAHSFSQVGSTADWCYALRASFLFSPFWIMFLLIFFYQFQHKSWF